MIQRAVQGATVRCFLYTYPSYGNELDTRVVVSPLANHPDRLTLEVEVCQPERACSGVGSQESSMNSGANSSVDSQVSRTSSSEHNDASLEAVRAHLKAMRAHRAMKDQQAELKIADRSGLTRNQSC